MNVQHRGHKISPLDSTLDDVNPDNIHTLFIQEIHVLRHWK
jgi:hypothetical protein